MSNTVAMYLTVTTPTDSPTGNGPYIVTAYDGSRVLGSGEGRTLAAALRQLATAVAA